MRRILRSALFHARKYDLGCPTEAKCAFFRDQQERACEGCPKRLTPVEPLPPPVAGARLRYLTQIESMVAVGCKFGPDDLTPRTWQELIWLRLERDRMDDLIRGAKDREPAAALPAEQQTRQNEIRRIDNIPPPGQSLFRGKK